MKTKNPVTSEIEAKEKLIVYVYEYLAHAGAKRAAQTFLEDINYDNDIEIKSMEGPGFLANWWCVFWDLYCAADTQSSEQATSEARAFQDLTRRGAPSQPTVIQHRPMPPMQCAQHHHHPQQQQQQLPQHPTNGQHFYLSQQSPLQMRTEHSGTFHRVANVSENSMQQQQQLANAPAGPTFMSVDGSTRYISAANAQQLAQMNATRQHGGQVLIRPTGQAHMMHSTNMGLPQHQHQQQLLQNVPCQIHRPTALVQMQAQHHNRFAQSAEWQNPDNSNVGDPQCFTPGSGTNGNQGNNLAMSLNGSGQQEDSTASNDGRLSKEGSEEYNSMPSNYGQDITDGGGAGPEEVQKLKGANLNNGSKEFNNDINNPSSASEFNMEYVSQVSDGASIINSW